MNAKQKVKIVTLRLEGETCMSCCYSRLKPHVTHAGVVSDGDWYCGHPRRSNGLTKYKDMPVPKPDIHPDHVCHLWREDSLEL